MKIKCECGGVIVDQTDFLPYKAHMISDQDWFDFLDAVDYAIEKSGPTSKEKESSLMGIRRLAIKLTRFIYQCASCGRLFIENENHELETFIKQEPYEGKQILASALGENWKRTLIGDWQESRNGTFKGYLWCMDVKSDECGFDNWKQLEDKYYSIFHELKSKDVLRSALLKKNYEVIHSWIEDKPILY